MNILAIDPSVNNVGIAWYSTEEKRLCTKLFHPPKGPTMVSIGIQIIKSIQTMKEFDVIIMEYPQYEGSARGDIASKKGYTLDLAFLCGFIGGFFDLGSAKTLTPTPREWKGNRPKSATEAEVKKAFSSFVGSEHEIDAVGMIFWYLRSAKTL